MTDQASPFCIGLIGTGYAAHKRFAALQASTKARVVAIAGLLQRCQELDPAHQAVHYERWQALLDHPSLDLVIIANQNNLHEPIALAALQAGLHVVCEYPLALEADAAEKLIAIAQTQRRLLHVEHIELLGSLHQTVRQYLPEVGKPVYARYVTISPKRPVTKRWNYQHQTFGFPFVAALSRFSRLIDLFGAVAQVSCQAQFDNIPETDYYRACLCNAQLQFQSGVFANVTYGKGEWFPETERSLVIHGDRGVLKIEGSQGELRQGEQRTPFTLSSRRGVFAQDTQQVLAHLRQGQPLYQQNTESWYALKIAQAAHQASQIGQTLSINMP